jgi:hypothetical protein
MRNTYNLLLWETDEKGPLRRPKIMHDVIKIEFNERI